MSSEPSQHLQELPERLYVLTKEESLCDVTITVKGKEFKAHSGVLAAASPFFFNLLTSNMIESREKLIKIQLEEATVAVMEDVLKYIYTGNVLMTEERAYDLIATADYLLLPGLKTMADNFLKEIVTTENCIANYYFAERYQCVELKAKSHEMINSNFSAVMGTDDFLKLEVKQVKEWVSGDDIIISAEEDVFKGIVRWVSHNKSEREGDFPELLDQVRLTSLTHNFVLNELEKEELVTKTDKLGMNFLLDTLKLMLNACDGQVNKQPRKCMEEHLDGIFVCGGKKALCYFPQQNLWYKLVDSPLQYQHFSVTQYQSKIYIFDNQSHALGSSLIMEYYMPTTNSWGANQLKAVNSVEANLANCTVLNDTLYATNVSTNEKIYEYNGQTNRWKQVDASLIKQENSCFVTENKYLYIIGGKRDVNALTTTTRFDPSNESSKWKTLAALNERRYSAFGAAMNGKVYIAGGLESSNRQPKSTCEVYDPVTDQWQLLPGLMKPRMSASMVCFDGKLYVFGGKAENTGSFGSSARVTIVEELDLERNKWVEKSAIPIKTFESQDEQRQGNCFQACSAKLYKRIIEQLEPLKTE